MASTEVKLWFLSSLEHFWPDPWVTLSKVALFFEKMQKVFKNKAQGFSTPLKEHLPTPNHTLSPSGRPSSSVWVENNKCINIGFGRFSTWGRGAQATANETSRPSACASHSRGSRGWPPGGGCKRTAPPCLRKFVFLRAKYAKFQGIFSEITEICDFRWSQGGSLLS